jgi:hypothetical protein
VLGGAEKVRPPREPELEPPPTRASADEIATKLIGNATDKTTASARTVPRAYWVNLISVPSNPRQGDAPLRWAVLPKSEAR